MPVNDHDSMRKKVTGNRTTVLESGLKNND
jgi:hypothetical protein